jgi:hypothetical protein
MKTTSARLSSLRSAPVRLLLLLFVVALLTSIASYAVVSVLGIWEKPVRRWVVGDERAKPPVLMLGSSLAYFAISVSNISAQLDSPVQSYWVASASTSELEMLAAAGPRFDTTILAVSLYDQNERILCEYRSQIVPLRRMLHDLWVTRSDWSFAKRVIAQYPMKYLRRLFPAAGRSLVVMISIKAKLLEWRDRIVGREPRVAASSEVDFDAEFSQAITDWQPSHLLEQITILRGLCQNRHAYDGPKHEALRRFVSGASRTGRVVVIVLPVSPEYRRALVTERAELQFEASLKAARDVAPGALWVRVDQLPELNSNQFFQDLAHMNSRGRKIATQAVCDALGASHR